MEEYLKGSREKWVKEMINKNNHANDVHYDICIFFILFFALKAKRDKYLEQDE